MVNKKKSWKVIIPKKLLCNIFSFELKKYINLVNLVSWQTALYQPATVSNICISYAVFCCYHDVIHIYHLLTKSFYYTYFQKKWFSWLCLNNDYLLYFIFLRNIVNGKLEMLLLLVVIFIYFFLLAPCKI